MSSLSVHELEIGRRLREWREARLYALSTFSDAISEGRERIASYEAGRVALRWGVFFKIWQRFGLSPRWLSASEGDISLAHEPFAYLLNEVPDGALFSAVYEDLLRDPIEKFICTNDAKLDEVIRELERRGLVDAGVAPLGRRLFRRMLQKMIAAGAGEHAEESSLDLFSVERNNNPVRKSISNVDVLLDHVRAATSARGAKRDLAKALDVSQQQLSDWLSLEGGKAPSAENALALLDRLTGVMTNLKKTPPVFAAQTARKAKAKHQRESKQSSGPPRK